MRRSELSVAVLLLGLLGVPGARAGKPAYPVSQVMVVNDTLHGTIVPDPYRWLEDADNPSVKAWTSAQNELTRATLGAFPGREKLRAQLEAPYSATSLASPDMYGSRLFYSKRTKLQNQPVIYYRDGAAGQPRVALDPNGFSTDGTVALDWMHPTPDGAFIAYGTSSGGTERSTLHVRDVTRGADLPEAIANTQHCSLVWDPDQKGFCYTRHPNKGEVPEGEDVFHVQIFHHRLGDDPKADPIVYSEGKRDIHEERAITGSSDHGWQFLELSLDWAKNDLYLRRNGTSEPFRPIADGLTGHVSADVSGSTLFIRSNVNSPKYHILTADVARPEPANWKEIIPEQSGVIESMTLAGGKLVLRIAEAGVSHLVVFTLEGKREAEIPLPSLGSSSDVTGDPASQDLYFVYRSFAQPSTIDHCDLRALKVTPLEPNESGIDPANYEVKQVFATSKDGTRVPMFVVSKKGLLMDGRRPTVLTGYGGFEVTEEPAFRAMWMPWLDMGGVYVDAGLRGGSEYGSAWHEAGRLAHKQNVFDDFYGCAQWLLDNQVTDHDHLAIEGGSNGGLLTGAALTQRPGMFKAVVCAVPLLDMIRFQKFLIGRYWVPEYGSSEDPEQFKYLMAYSPYQNVRPAVDYPATLFEASEGDYRVDACHAKKMTARVQAATSSDAPILLRVESKAGHGQGKPTAKRIDEAVDILSFLMMQMGLSTK